MSEQLRAGFIGLGSQGAPMARRIAEGGIPLTLWARRPASLEPFADTGAKTASTPAELAANSDVIGLCVRDDNDIEQVTSGEDGVLPGSHRAPSSPCTARCTRTRSGRWPPGQPRRARSSWTRR
jgi:3-hydroxyisobutyrate dehydrogenase-like beta-hydroxyacid dehydrogenase